MRAIDIDMSIYDDDDAGAEGGGDIIFNIKKMPLSFIARKTLGQRRSQRRCSSTSAARSAMHNLPPTAF